MLKTLLHPLRLLLIFITLGCGTSDESGTIVEEFPVNQSEADYSLKPDSPEGMLFFRDSTG